ncbi:MAG TPA: hypothetical protein VOA87_04165 [Thermoanaerobaculia bacterium]|nr:hypothetical protein [Thermoanaerobaculia bacterium]
MAEAEDVAGHGAAKAAQAKVGEVAAELQALRDRLSAVAASLGPERETASDADEEPDVATELRSVIQCVLKDDILPAINDLLDASRYPAEGERK